MPVVKLFVSGLLEGGEAQFERTLLSVDGVYGVVASHVAGCCEIDFEDDVVGIDDLLDIARRAGYEARLAG